MDLFIRARELSQVFSYNVKTRLTDVPVDILSFQFRQTDYVNEIEQLQKQLLPTGFCPTTDDCIEENKQFEYTVFSPRTRDNHQNAILLLHGLNERSWDKYLTWAEQLVLTTGKPVILFPIAFHMNRAPRMWCNPRSILPWVNARKQEVSGIPNSTFANVALSSRISKQPIRFYVSGLQSAYNILQLSHEIKSGQHSLFAENCNIDIFAYSIGAFLSQIVLLANPDKLFTDSKLFMFCGGSIFSEMNGCARDILDKEASDRLMNYYINEFMDEYPLNSTGGDISLEQAFRMMISPEMLKTERESFFQSACNRIKAISLKADVVIPTEGIMKALGKASHSILEELDFNFAYSHQIPFPMNDNRMDLVNNAFRQVFDKASAFFTK